MKSKILTLAVILLISLSLLVCKSKKDKATAANPGKDLNLKSGVAYNLLLITLDTVRHDRLGVYSQKYVKTPNLDWLAAKSVVFNRAFAHNSVTLPSHINILTGTTPLYHGISDNSGFRLADRFLTMAEFLKDKGYATGAFVGAFPLDSRFGLNQGFDVYDDNYGTHNSLKLFYVERRAEQVIKPAAAWISARQGKWFAWIHLFDPHQPYMPPPPFDARYAHDPYSGEVAYVDQELGTLFFFLKEKKMMENTVVILTADHGEALGEKGEKTHSYFAYNNTILIPLIIHIPGLGAKHIDENVSHVDIFPTCCDILGFQAPVHLQGESLLPIINGKKRQKSEIYFESLTPYLNRGWAPLTGFIRHHIKFIDLPIKEVYDLDRDIDEKKNLVSSSDVKKLLKDLEKMKDSLRGEFKVKRASKLDADEQRRLRSLGYLADTSAPRKEVFTRQDDLKTLLPLQNRMLEAVGKMEEGKVDESISELKAVIAESPGFVLVYNHLANVYQEVGETGEAVAILKQGLSKNPGNLSLLSKLGIILAEANQHQEAVEILKQCVKRESFNPDNFNYLGVAYYKSGNFQLALENYQKALELDNNYASVYNNFGSLYLVVYLKDRDERAYNLAMENFNRALEIDPRLFAAYNGRGAAFHYRNDYEKAIADWEKAIEIKPDYIDPYFSVGITYLKIGDKASALKQFLLLKERLYEKLPLKEQQRLERLIAESRY